MFCAHCGTNTAGSAYCSNCGRPASAAALPDQRTTPEPSRRTGVVTAVAVSAALFVAVVVGGVALLTHRGDDSPPAIASSATSGEAQATVTVSASAPSSSAALASTAAAATTSTGTGPVSDLPAGLFCRDLYARGYSYVAAIEYWRTYGDPNQMDVDRNGIPCQTVYPATDVSAYWGMNTVPTQYGFDAGALPAGLFCRDLYARGVSYTDAVAYWWYSGSPDQMDADKNGIPCETVYSTFDVDSFWYR